MSNFRLIAAGVDVSAILAELDAQPELWNTRTYRTEDPTSPHNGVDDIWLRYRAATQLSDHESHVEPHLSQFWPAWEALPSLHVVVRNLAHAINAVQWGGFLITRIPPGGEVKPHVDPGWHAGWYDQKLYLTLRANPLCLNYCGDDVENFRAGDVWEFPNNVEHSVVNRGGTDRITVILCFRSAERDLADAKAMTQVPQLRKTGPAPSGTDMTLHDGLFVKHMVFNAGDYIPQHSHEWDHVSVIAAGAVRAWADDELLGEFVAPARVVIKARTKHMFLALEPATTILCVHRVTEDGDIPVHDEHQPEFVGG